MLWVTRCRVIQWLANTGTIHVLSQDLEYIDTGTVFILKESVSGKKETSKKQIIMYYDK